MLRRRLYLQIYGILIMALLAVVITFGVIGLTTKGPNEGPKHLGNTVGKLAALALPESTASPAVQQAELERIAKALGWKFTMLDASGDLIANVGPVQKMLKPIEPKVVWQKRLAKDARALSMPDGRLLLIEGLEPPHLPPTMRIHLLLAVIVLSVGIISYPFVRRLTRRLEDLKNDVDTIASGDLKVRVPVEGKDEIAILTSSFNDAASRIEDLLNSQKMLLANASHELRTPLSRIRLGVELLENKQNTGRIHDLRRDIAELDVLIDEILLMSRLDTGIDVVLEDEIDLVAVVAEECVRFQDCHLQGTVPSVVGDRQLLSRLVRNLLQNAVIHGETPIHVELETQNSDITLTVKDAGKGFPKHEKNRLFKAFQRGPDRQNVPGFGLGLALVQQITQAHNGSVNILPKSQAQSAIRVCLPLSSTH